MKRAAATSDTHFTHPGARLPIRTDPGAGEHTVSLLMRLAELNGYVSPTWLPQYLSRTSANYERRKSAGFKHRELQKLVKVLSLEQNADRLGGYRLENDGLYCIGMGRTVARSAVQLTSPKVCPRCLQERRFIEAAWDLVFWVACPIHGCTMVSACEACGKRLSWSRTRYDRCCPEAPFTSAPSTPAPGSTVSLARLIARAVGYPAPSPPEQLLKLVGDLDGTQLSHLASRTLRTSRFPELSIAPGSTANLLTSKEATQKAEDAVVFLDQWPQKFHDMLESTGDSDDHRTFTSAFNKLHPGLITNKRANGFPFVKAEYDAWLIRRYPKYAFSKRQTTTVGDSSVMSASAVRQAMKMDRYTLTKATMSGAIVGRKITRGKGSGWMYDRAYITELARDRANLIEPVENVKEKKHLTQLEAASLLGISDFLLLKMQRDGLVGLPTQVGRYLLNDAAPVLEMVQKLNNITVNQPARHPKTRKRSKVAAVTLASLCRSTREAFCDLLKLVLAGHLSPCERVDTATGVAALRFRTADANALLARRGKAASSRDQAAVHGALRGSKWWTQRLASPYGQSDCAVLSRLRASSNAGVSRSARIIMSALKGFTEAQTSKSVGCSLKAIRIAKSRYKADGVSAIGLERPTHRPPAKADAFLIEIGRVLKERPGLKITLRQLRVEIQARTGLIFSEHYFRNVIKKDPALRDIVGRRQLKE